MRRHLQPKRLLHYALVLAGVGILGVTIAIISAFASLPSLDLVGDRQVSESTKIFDRTGQVLLYEIYGEERRTVVPFEKIPQQAKDATIAIEDAGFYEHSAIDFRGLTRAMLNNLGLLFKDGGLIQGGSTITQQLAKKAFLSDERTLTRKVKEVLIAYKLEQEYTKDQILELYLNQIPYGNNAYGIESAAKTYFQKSVADLSLAQVALLAALPQAPSYFDPFGSHLKALLERKNLVLDRMLAENLISKEEHVAAKKEEFVFTQPKTLERAPHFALMVKEYLEEQYGEEFVRRAGLSVTTTLDTKLQEVAEQAVVAGAARNTELYKGTNAALVAEDPTTGQILAMVGSRNFFDKEIDGQFNVAAQGLRQPGSTLKPFVYLAALQRGFTPDTIFFDVPTEFFPDQTRCPQPPLLTNLPDDPESPCFHPENFDHRFVGPVSLRSSLAQSRNVPAVQALYMIGLSEAVSTLRSFGLATLSDPNRYGLSLVLGGGEVRLVDLVSAYGGLAQDGVRHTQRFILSVVDKDGRSLEEYVDSAESVADQNAVRAINEILSDKDLRAPLFSGSLNLTVFPGYDVAIKTGTTNDYRDAWGVGYSPSIAVGVWAGNNDNAPMQRQGGSILAAVPILNAFLKEALPLVPNQSFTAPEPITLSSKPLLNGSPLAVYELNGVLYPQVHSLLHYVDRKNPTGPSPAHPELDSQFKNWEQAVLAWATSTIPGIQLGTNYNLPVPAGATLTVSAPAQVADVISVISPAQGFFIQNGLLPIQAEIRSTKELVRFEVLFNGVLIDSRIGSLGTSLSYTVAYSTGGALAQNTLTLRATDITGFVTSKEVVVYQ